MRILQVQPGVFVILDNEDYDTVANLSWYLEHRRTHIIHKYYVRIKGKLHQKHIRLENFLIEHDPKLYYVVHKTENIFDFRKDNLEAVPIGRFNASRNLLRTNTSGFKGVTWRKDTGRWMAQITCNGVHYNLGSFLELKDAALAYNKKALDVYGDKAWLNDVDSFEAVMKLDAHKPVKGNPHKNVKKQYSDKHSKDVQGLVRELFT